MPPVTANKSLLQQKMSSKFSGDEEEIKTIAESLGGETQSLTDV